jgi:glutathione S-transferase
MQGSYLGMPKNQEDIFLSKQKDGYAALDVMEYQLSKTTFLAGGFITIADISLYAYTHVSHEGGFDLTKYSNIQKWIKKIKSLPNYVSMTNNP